MLSTGGCVLHRAISVWLTHSSTETSVSGFGNLGSTRVGTIGRKGESLSDGSGSPASSPGWSLSVRKKRRHSTKPPRSALGISFSRRSTLDCGRFVSWHALRLTTSSRQIVGLLADSWRKKLCQERIVFSTIQRLKVSVVQVGCEGETAAGRRYRLPVGHPSLRIRSPTCRNSLSSAGTIDPSPMGPVFNSRGAGNDAARSSVSMIASTLLCFDHLL